VEEEKAMGGVGLGGAPSYALAAGVEVAWETITVASRAWSQDFGSIQQKNCNFTHICMQKNLDGNLTVIVDLELT
jgi:hypothetical protein